MADSDVLVIYVSDPERARSLLEKFGLVFALEKHAAGPEHYAAVTQTGDVLEIYPGERPARFLPRT